MSYAADSLANLAKIVEGVDFSEVDAQHWRDVQEAASAAAWRPLVGTGSAKEPLGHISGPGAEVTLGPFGAVVTPRWRSVETPDGRRIDERLESDYDAKWRKSDKDFGWCQERIDDEGKRTAALARSVWRKPSWWPW